MSDETAAWVEAQNKVTFAYLETIPFRDALKDRMTEIWNYPKMSTPFKEGERYFYFYNTERPHQSFDGATPKEIYLGLPVPGKDGGVINPAEEKACALVDDSCGSVGPRSVRPETCGRTMDNDKPVAHSSTTLPGLSPTGCTGSTMAIS